MSAACRATAWDISESEDECDIETKTESVAVIVERTDGQRSDDTTPLTLASTNEPNEGQRLCPPRLPGSRVPGSTSPPPRVPGSTSPPPRVPGSTSPSPDRKRRSRCLSEAEQRRAKQKRDARDERRAAGGERRAARDEQRAAGDEQRAAGGERRAAGGERRAAGGERRAAGGERRAAGGERRAAGGERRAAGGERRAAGAAEKEERKRQQQERKKLAELTRSLRPENCLKNLTVCIDPALLQHSGSDVLLERLSTAGWRFVIDSQPLHQTICWTRELSEPGEDGCGWVEEEQVSWVLDLADFIDVVLSVKEILQGNEDPSRQSLLAGMLEFLNGNANKVVTMLVIGSQMNSSAARSAPSLQAHIGMEDLDLEEVMVYLQLYRNVSLSFFRDWQAVTEHLVGRTKALSKIPSRQLSERGGLPFCVDGPWASGVRVKKEGTGLRQVWNRQVQQLNRVSVAVATAVTTAYPSPHLLLQAYGSLDSEELRRKLLAHLSVVSEGKERRVGPDISSRIYRCLSEQNPEMGLD